MKDSEVSQIGIHDILIALDGEFKRLYEAQVKWYIEDIDDDNCILCKREKYKLQDISRKKQIVKLE